MSRDAKAFIIITIISIILGIGVNYMVKRNYKGRTYTAQQIVDVINERQTNIILWEYEAGVLETTKEIRFAEHKAIMDMLFVK
jgi:hypothetical protein